MIECPVCGSVEIENYITIPERTSNTKIGKCRKCGYEILHGDIYGESIFDSQEEVKDELIVAEDGWCPVCKKGTETGKTYCDEHKPVTTKFLTFFEVESSGVTRRFHIYSGHSKDYLGRIYWRNGWRRYVMHFDRSCDWSVECLADCYKFLAKLTQDRKVKS